jgi:hypothetical protein
MNVVCMLRALEFDEHRHKLLCEVHLFVCACMYVFTCIIVSILENKRDPNMI